MTALIAVWEVAKRILGLLPPKVWLALAAFTLVLGYHFYALHERGVQEYARGKSEAAAQCEADKKTAQAAHDKEVADLKKRNQEEEQEQATELAVLGANYEQDLQDTKDQAARDVAAARSGALRLRVAGVCSNPSGGSAAAEASTASSERHGPSICELPAETTRRLFELADDADATVKQLTACQAIVDLDRKGQS